MEERIKRLMEEQEKRFLRLTGRRPPKTKEEMIQFGKDFPQFRDDAGGQRFIRWLRDNNYPIIKTYDELFERMAIFHDLEDRGLIPSMTMADLMEDPEMAIIARYAESIYFVEMK